MEFSIENRVLNQIKKTKRGTLLFGQNFVSQGSSDAVRKSLERLVKKDEIERVATGIYIRPEIDPIVGKVPPSIESIVKAIAKRDKARVRWYPKTAHFFA
jgi:CO dehydrogenase/acetyl-CoA synthase epsilon subunit